jgi:hypothetical protein
MAPLSSAAVNPSDMDLGPCRIKFGGVDLGGTLGGVKIMPKFSKANLNADQFGKTVVDRIVDGLEITVETELTEIKNKDMWKKAIANAKLITSGGNKAILLQSAIGSRDSDLAGQLQIHPLTVSEADLTGDWLFYKAVPVDAVEINYGPSEQRRLKVTWNIYPDTSVQPARFAFHGDPAVGATAASAAAAVAGGGNVGNGTVSGLLAHSGLTKTETISLLCIHAAANAGIFQVTGSLSGHLGNATVGIGFTSPVLDFLINDGATDFALGDTFTIATTAANYV